MNNQLKFRLHQIIFEADTPAGRAFDIALLALISASIIAVILESVSSVSVVYHAELRAFEWFCTAAFSLEYLLRLYCLQRPLRYAGSFFGIVDLLAVLPGYLSWLLPGMHELMVIRILRLLRIFRILKLARYVGESTVLVAALVASRRKIGIFLFAVLNVVVIVGALMHLVEGPENGFTDIPTSMYWAIVTLTTVGYGDLSPATPFGRLLASFIMIIGYGVIAVPTGIVSVELSRAVKEVSTGACAHCGRSLLSIDTQYCPYCGGRARYDTSQDHAPGA
jgi:voltage-gated potassium channel